MANKTIKQMLIDLYKEEREQERCTLVHELKKEANDFTKPYMDRIFKLRAETSDLDSQMHELRIKIREEEEARDDYLRDIKLYSFTNKTCGDSLHEQLQDFDKEPNNHIREILESGKKPEGKPKKR